MHKTKQQVFLLWVLVFVGIWGLVITYSDQNFKGLLITNHGFVLSQNDQCVWRGDDRFYQQYQNLLSSECAKFSGDEIRVFEVGSTRVMFFSKNPDYQSFLTSNQQTRADYWIWPQTLQPKFPPPSKAIIFTGKRAGKTLQSWAQKNKIPLLNISQTKALWLQADRTIRVERKNK